MIEFYNSLTKKKEVFKPIDKNKVKIYSCGPTVYNFVHIGNLRSFVFADLIKRVFSYFDFEVENVVNITDVDDKTILNSKKDKTLKEKEPKKRLKEFTEKYLNYFLEDISKLNILKPKFMPKATQSIKDIEYLINLLYEKGIAYISDDGVYFSIKKDKYYGQLVNIDFSKQKENLENRQIVDEYEKEEVQDFALWKFKKEEDEPSWKIKIGEKEFEGRPGWHIECSAMSYKYLGKVFDIHTGGIDLKFPHHENEIAQSSCALGVKVQANYWLHNEHLLVDGKKMSKSLGNFYTLRDIEKKGFLGIHLREMYLRAHYRQQLNFTFESLEMSKKNVQKINDFYLWLENKLAIQLEDSLEEERVNKEFEKLFYKKLDEFELALKDDLNTPVAIASLYEFIRDVYKINNLTKFQIEKSKEFIERVNRVFALLDIKNNDIPNEVLELAMKRKKARDEKDFELADKLREKIKKLGYEIKDKKDTKEGFVLIENEK